MKYPGPHKAIVYLLICFLLCYTVGQAQDNMTTQLSSISGQLFKRNNPRFILVEALKDSLIQAGHQYDFRSEDTGISINGHLVGEPFQSTYTKLLESFYKRQNVEINGKLVNRSYAKGVRMAGDNLSLAEILDPNSGFWAQYDTDPTAQYFKDTKLARHTEATNAILKEMAAEGIIDTTKEVDIFYTKTGFIVNGKQLPLQQEQKYKRRFDQVNGFDHGIGDGSVFIRHSGYAAKQEDKAH